MNKLIMDGNEYELEEYGDSNAASTPAIQFKGKYYIGKAVPKEKPKNYEVLSVFNVDNENIIVTAESAKKFWNKLEDYYMKNNNLWKIRCVKRLPDGEIFTVGDVCSDGDDICTFKPIKRFFIVDDVMYAQFNEGHGSNGCRGINGLKKVKQPLFQSFDGVDIFSGDNVWLFSEGNFIIRELHINEDFKTPPFEGTDKHFKYFSTKEAAEEYIFLNSKQIAINDLKEWHSKYYLPTNTEAFVNTIIELVKEKSSNV